MNKFRFKKESVSPAVWQIWLAYVPFEGTGGGKKRPVVVIGTDGQYCTVAEMTSKPPAFVSDVAVIDLNTAGLGKESVIQTRKIRRLSKMSLSSYLGTLSNADRERVRDAIKGKVF